MNPFLGQTVSKDVIIVAELARLDRKIRCVE